MPRKVPLTFLSLAILYAPLAYGCTTEVAIWWLDGMLAATVATWLCWKFQEGSSFRISPFAAVVVMLLALVAVVQVFNPHSVFDPKTWDLRTLNSGLPFLPRTTDQATSLRWLPHLLALGGGFLALIDLSEAREVRWWVLRAMVLGGLCVAFIGFVEKAAGGNQLLWGHLHPSQTTYFATFRYHGNAAAFLNLCWPAALALFLRSILRENHLGRSLWGMAWLFIFAALFVNTSKFGHAAAVPLLLLWAVLHMRLLPGDWLQLSWRNALVSLVIIAVLAGLALPTMKLTLSLWDRHLEDGLTLHLRRDAYAICLQMAREAPLFGFGTGSFRILFPYHSLALGDLIQGRWTCAHQDYLQTIIEWGWAGMALWACLFAPPLVMRVFRRGPKRIDLSAGAALTGISAILIHAMVDFPLQIASIHFYCLLYLAFLWRSHHHRETGP